MEAALASSIPDVMKEAMDWNEPTLALTALYSALGPAAQDRRLRIVEAIRLAKLAQKTGESRWLIQAHELIIGA